MTNEYFKQLLKYQGTGLHIIYSTTFGIASYCWDQISIYVRCELATLVVYSRWGEACFLSIGWVEVCGTLWCPCNFLP